MRRWFGWRIGNAAGIAAGIVLAGMTGAFGLDAEAGESAVPLGAQWQEVRAALDCVAGRSGSPAGCLAFGRFGGASVAGTWCGLPAAVERAFSVPGFRVRSSEAQRAERLRILEEAAEAVPKRRR